MDTYRTLGELLLEYFKRLNFENQEEEARHLQIGVKSYRKWLKGPGRMSYESLQNVSDITLIPFEVLFRLNNKYPTLYDKGTRRYATCPFNTDIVNPKTLRDRLFETQEIGNVFPLKENEDIHLVHRFNKQFYPAPKVATKKKPNGTSKAEAEEKIRKEISMLIEATKKLPGLAWIIKDPRFYCGHMICFPLSMETFEKLRSGELLEFDLKPSDLVTVTPDEPVAFHFFGMFATHSTFMYCLMKKFVYFFNENVEENVNGGSIISRYSITSDGHVLSEAMEMKSDKSYHQRIDIKQSNSPTPRLYWKNVMGFPWLKASKEKLYY